MHNFEIHPTWLILSGIALALVPLVVPMITGWTKITIILGFIRNGLGFQHTGAALVDGSLGLLIATIISAPVYSSLFAELEVAYQDVKLSRAPSFQQLERVRQIMKPLGAFLESNSGETELKLANNLVYRKVLGTRDDSINEEHRVIRRSAFGDFPNHVIAKATQTEKSCAKNSISEVACLKDALGTDLTMLVHSGGASPSEPYISNNLFNDKSSQESQTQGLKHVSETGSQSSILVTILAFFLTEVREGLVLGLKILVPFLVVDFIVANLLAGMGMFLLSPQVITLPLKVLLFLGAGGYTLLTHGAVLGYVLQ